MHPTQRILDEYTTISVTPSWDVTTFHFSPNTQQGDIYVRELTKGEDASNYISITNKYFLSSTTSRYIIKSDLIFHHDFEFNHRFILSRQYYTDISSSGKYFIKHKNQVHRYQNSRICNYLDFQTDNFVSHVLVDTDNVIAVFYLPFEYNPMKKYDFLKINPSIDLQVVLPLIIAFTSAVGYGQYDPESPAA